MRPAGRWGEDDGGRAATTTAREDQPMTQTSDLQPRSRDVTQGLERAAARGMLRAVGMRDEDFSKPQIGIASSWNEITPCNLSLQRLGVASKEGVHRAGGFPSASRPRAAGDARPSLLGRRIKLAPSIPDLHASRRRTRRGASGGRGWSTRAGGRRPLRQVD